MFFKNYFISCSELDSSNMKGDIGCSAVAIGNFC